MGVESKFARFSQNTGFARFFIPIGVILIVFGVIMSGFKTENYEKTVGTVTQVVESMDYDADHTAHTVYDVSFTFTVDGKTFSNEFSGFSEKYEVGDAINIFYDAENPEQISNTRGIEKAAPFMIAAGVAAIVFGVFKTVQSFRKSKEPDETAQSIVE